MVDLDHLSAEDLRSELERVESKTPAMRLIVALNHKHGLTQTEIAEQYGIARKTVYNWLVRFERHEISEAIVDDTHPGRPSKLSTDQQQRLEKLLREPPPDAGYDADHWTPALVCELVSDEFSVEYSIPHIRRVMHESGLVPTDDGEWIHESPPPTTLSEQ
jgi:transposase